MMRSIRGSSSKLPSRVPRLSGRRLEARRVLRKRVYYLNVMAGPLREWRFLPAPEVEWIMKRDA